MKPHEETWEIDSDGDIRRLNPRGERAGLVFLRAASGSPEATELAVAAPEMARALIHVLACRNPSGRCPSCDRKVRHALGLAGVDIP